MIKLTQKQTYFQKIEQTKKNSKYINWNKLIRIVTNLLNDGTKKKKYKLVSQLAETFPRAIKKFPK